MKTIHLTTIQFPEVKLQTRDAHKLRGYFGNLFKEHSPLLHNHYENGAFRHRYPLVQYKVLNGIPSLVAAEEGANLITSLFLKINQLQIDGQVYEVHAKNIASSNQTIGYTDELKEYRFETLWMALNQENYRKYRDLDQLGQNTMLNKILIGHILSFYKQMDHFLESNQRLLAKTKVRVKSTQFKEQKMMAFSGNFVVNAVLPDNIGLGKAVSRGFGTIKAL